MTDCESVRPRPTKHAIWCAFVGAKYVGMQIQVDQPTIENSLHEAMFSAGCVPDSGFEAFKQVVALNMRVDPDPDTVRDAINAHLPSDIRVLGIVRVTKGFDARRVCDKRKYEYWLPLWVLDPQVGREHLLLPPRLTLADRFVEPLWRKTAPLDGLPPATAADTATAADAQPAPEQHDGGDASAAAEPSEDAASGDEGDDAPLDEEDFEEGAANIGKTGLNPAKRPRRILPEGSWPHESTMEWSPALAEQLSTLCNGLQGTHSFHNFTTEVPAGSAKAKRFIISVVPELASIQGSPWVRFCIEGQSFMLHQIRRMIGMIVAIARGAAPASALPAALDPRRELFTPMAPELGLFLAETCFDSYNSRHASVKDGRPAVDLAAYPQAQQFKESHILAHIAAHDRAHHDFYRWLRILHNDVFGFATWSSTKTNMPRPGHKRKAPEPSVGTTAANGDATAIPEKKLHAET